MDRQPEKQSLSSKVKSKPIALAATSLMLLAYTWGETASHPPADERDRKIGVVFPLACQCTSLFCPAQRQVQQRQSGRWHRHGEERRPKAAQELFGRSEDEGTDACAANHAASLYAEPLAEPHRAEIVRDRTAADGAHQSNADSAGRGVYEAADRRREASGCDCTCGKRASGSRGPRMVRVAADGTTNGGAGGGSFHE